MTIDEVPIIISLLGVIIFIVVILSLLFKKQTQKFIVSDKATQIQQKNQRKNDILDRINWEMIGGYEDVKKEIKEYIEFPLKYKELSRKYGIKPPKGILLFGPPGCGKTLMMRALANEAKINFIYVNVSDIMSKWYGESEARLRELFANARKNSPCILFFDEIDTIGVRRESHTGDSVTPRLLSLMLSEIDGLQGNDGIILVGSTNIPHLLDKALLRAGRFDKLIYIGLPDKRSRREILEIHCKAKPLESDVDFDKLAEMTERFTGADLANLCQEVARRAAIEALERNVERKISMQDFNDVIKRYKPSVTLQMLEEYEKFRLDYERKFRGPEITSSDNEKITLDDIGGYNSIKKELYELLEIQLRYSKLMEQMKIPPIRGILLHGPPGVGKTMMAKALSKTLGVKFIMISGAEILYKGYEGAVSTIKEVFNRARENKPAIVLLDEIDAIAPRRENQKTDSSKVVNQLLTEMDGIRSLKEVVVIATTNRMEDVDPALKRPGRFDRIVYMPLPNSEEREDILQKYIGLEECKMVKCDQIAKVTEGYSGADLAAIAREAKLKVLREIIRGNVDRKLSYEDLIEAASKIKPSVKQERKILEDFRQDL
ncbi:AAA family ATPase [Sulfolobus acidocaldarius]|uniref:SAV protein-like n=4 Tax=Sulfolobus acidocaldarius TaxID=2285 RepID=Q4JA89_SULAC|nr:AAA family ATPase [Sulfolobus acidocaldarius]AAY80291.1 SAV protein-like [Sulfolobus acidocaldarius DSM 639]AGE70872.1 SAV protein-like protein [Sulfolobus acidocaldarius N8]AGE73143.1 SAV protein-like protein [Sulfolobus acidocaldarius Ron12/I]ALU28820.1 AAA family ATPase [Sulfolobus acidocaldarius]ALU31540.1 AAA family ATPase [Sulfolobus acidocaldarius]